VTEALALRPIVFLPLLVGAGLYLRGWSHLVRRAPGLARDRHLLCVLAGLLAIGIALSPGVDAAAHREFSAHMVQHLLLVLVAPPLCVLGAPVPITLWGLPRAVRRLVPRVLAAGTLGRRLLRAFTAMPVAWTIHVLVVWLWHVPALYEAALASALLHDLEHITLFVTGVLFWWPIVEPAPRLHPARPLWSRIVYLVVAGVQSSALGLGLVLSPVALYPSYGVLDDQVWGGLLMWTIGSTVDMLALLVVIGRFLGRVP
jgi:cytochrome c oxidase assembly factor CtaG